MTAQRKLVRGAVGYAFRQVAITGLGFGANLFLTRLLFPADFGYIATVNILLQLVQLVANGGLGVYLIQREEEIQDNDLSRVMSLQLSIYLVCHFVSSIATAGAFALKSDMSLWMLLWVAFFAIPFSLIRSASLIKLERGLEFQTIALLETAEQLLYSVLLVVLAFVHAGAWSVVLASLARAVFGLILASYYAPWHFSPHRPKITAELRKGIIFGVQYQLPSLLEIGRAAILPVMVGGLLGAQNVGYVDRAFFIANLPVLVLAAVQQRLLFPYFARIQSNPETVRKAFEETIYLSAIMDKVAYLPLFLFLPELVRIVFSEKWIPIVPLVYVIAVGSVLVGAISFSSVPTLNGLGQSQVFAKVSLANLIISWLLAWPFITAFGIVGYTLVTQLLWLGIFYFVIEIRKHIKSVSVWRPIFSPVLAFLSSLVITRMLVDWLAITAASLLQIIGFSVLSITVFFAILFLLDRQRFLLTLGHLSRNLK